MKRKLILASLLLLSFTMAAQNRDTAVVSITDFRLDEGTFSWRGTNTFHDMTSWDTQDFTEGHLKQKSGSTWHFRLNYRLLFPRSYNRDYKPGYPIIIMMHGAGERGNCWDNNCYCKDCNANATPDPNANPQFLNNDHMLLLGGQAFLKAVNLAGSRKPDDPALPEGAFPGFVLYPQNENYWGNPSAGNSPVSYALRILRLLIKEHNIDPDRVYIVGLSMGGQATYKALNMADWLFAAAITMSAVNFSNSFEYDSVANIPLWAFQGGLDKSPRPSQTEALLRKFREAGGIARYTFYQEAGHNTWNRAFREPDIFSWLLSKKKNNLHVYYNNPNVCATNNKGARLGLAGGFPAYQWERDGTVIGNARSHELIAEDPGVYRARYSRVSSNPGEADWSEWSPPITIQKKVPQEHKITQVGTTYLPDLNGNRNAMLKAPEGIAHYYWYKNGVLTGFPDTMNLTVSPGNCGKPCANTGRYTLITADFDKCPSFPSQPKYLFFEDQATVNNTMRPQSLQTEIMSSSSCFLRWRDVSTAETEFEVWRKNTSAANSSWVLAGLLKRNITFFLDTMLQPNSVYFYKIRALNETSRSDYFPGNDPVKPEESVVVNTPNENDQPAPPQNLTAKLIGVNKIQLVWEPGRDESGIKQYLVTVNGETIRTRGQDTTYTLSDLAVNTRYTFTVKTVDISSNESAPSNQVSTTTHVSGLFYKHTTGAWTSLDEPSMIDSWTTPEYTGTVSNFSLTPRVEEDYFNFEFEGYLYISTAGNYTFYLNSDDGSRLYLNNNMIVDFDETHGMCSGNSLSTTCPNNWGRPSQSISLNAGAHLIRVRYFDYTGSNHLLVRYNGPDTGFTGMLIPNQVLTSGSYTPPANLPTPGNLQAVSGGMTQIKLTWNASAGTNVEYEIYRASSANGPFTIINRVSGQTYSDANLRAGKTYFYKLKAATSNNTSGFSTVASAKTQRDAEPPSQPTRLVAESGNFSKTVLTWNSATDNIGVAGYEIWGNDALLGTSRVPAFEVVGLEPGKTYTFYVKAYDYSENRSEASESVTNEEFVTDSEHPVNSSFRLDLFPNPTASQNITIKLFSTNQHPVTLIIKDRISRTIYKETFEYNAVSEAYTIPINRVLTNGLYMVILQQQNKTATRKLVIKN